MNRETVVKNISWFIPWTAGFLFTLGYIGVTPNLEKYSWYWQIVVWLISYFFWPYFLGHALAGG